MRSLTSLVVVVAVVAGAGCATTTKITSEPPGAVVVSAKDKKELGKTPMKYESKMWIWESEQLLVKAPGYKERPVELKRSDPDVVPILGSLCLLPVCCSGAVIFAAGGLKLPEDTKVTLEKEAPPPNPVIGNGVDGASDAAGAVALAY